jgi:hypothetical protein
MGEAERASKAWLNMMGASYGKRLSCEGAPQKRVQSEVRRQPAQREYRWIELADGRRIFRPVAPEAESKRSHLPAPQISLDYQSYDCPVTGRMIEGRRAHRENLKLHNCRVLEPGETAQHRRERPKQKAAALDRAIDECAHEATRELFV